MSDNKPSKEQIDKWKSRVDDPTTDDKSKERFRNLLKKWDKAVEEVEEAVDAMKKRGLVVNKPNAEQTRAWNDLAEKLYPRIRGTLVPADTFDEVFRHLKAYRASKGK
jgi:hypothetical protein